MVEQKYYCQIDLSGFIEELGYVPPEAVRYAFDKIRYEIKKHVVPHPQYETVNDPMIFVALMEEWDHIYIPVAFTWNGGVLTGVATHG